MSTFKSNGRAAGFDLHQGRRIDVLVFQGDQVGELVRGKCLFDEAPSSRDDVGEIRVSGSMPRNRAVSKLDQNLGWREIKMVVEKNDSQLLVHAMLDEDAADDRLQGLDGSGWLCVATGLQDRRQSVVVLGVVLEQSNGHFDCRGISDLGVGGSVSRMTYKRI